VVTLGFLHAHPDDEALLTSGTMARATAEGHRVVLITATDGAAGLASSAYTDGLAEHRRRELADSARILGVARTISLGFPDSGLTAQVPDGFAHQPVDVIAAEVAGLIDAEDIDVLVGYDPTGGYGHPDHVQVHRVARAAAEASSREPLLFEATIPREPIATAVGMATRLGLTPDGFDASPFLAAYTPHGEITHRVNVRGYLDAKRASMRAHASQASADDSTRTLAVLAGLPRPVFAALLGTEYYVRVR
jgi:LmbE family N-acetylglucosaminyl deacetylase